MPRPWRSACRADRPVVALMGDGSMHYAITALWSAARYKIPVTVVVASNAEYGVVKEFGVWEKTPNVPGLDVPGLDVVATAASYGVDAHEAHSSDEVFELVKAGVANRERPTLINATAVRLRRIRRLTGPGAAIVKDSVIQHHFHGRPGAGRPTPAAPGGEPTQKPIARTTGCEEADIDRGLSYGYSEYGQTDRARDRSRSRSSAKCVSRWRSPIGRCWRCTDRCWSHSA